MDLSGETLALFERGLDYRLYWSALSSSHCINTGWRILPFWVVLSVERGSYVCSLEQDGQQRNFRAGPGEVLLVPAGRRHKLRVDEATTASGFHIDYRLFRRVDVLAYYRIPVVLCHQQAQAVAESTSRLAAVNEDRDSMHLATLALRHAHAYGLLYALLEMSESLPDAKKQLLTLRRLQPAIAYIDEHLDQPILVEELASLCSLSRNRFGDLFKNALERPPKQYIDQQRINRAMSLLVHSDRTVVDIAASLGYCDAFHFSKQFKRATDLTPSQYRKAVKETL